MLVAHWNFRFYPTSGGIESHIASIIRNLPDVRFVVITNALSGQASRALFAENASIQRFRPVDSMHAPSPRWGRKVLLPASAGADVVRVLRERRFLRVHPPDVVHVHDVDANVVGFVKATQLPLGFVRRYASLFAPHALPAPAVLTKHFDFMRDRGSIWAIWEEAFTLLFRNIIVLRKDRQAMWERICKDRGLDARIWFLPNGVDLDLFRPGPPSEGRDLRVGYAGRLDSLKGEALLREIIGGLPEGVRFHGAFSVAGRTPGWTSAMSRDRVQMEFNRRPEAMPEFYRSVDVVINTTQIPADDRTILEAFACGKPVVKVSTTSDYPVIHDETGILVPPDAPSFLRALEMLRDDRQAVDGMGRRARDLVSKEFDAGVLAGKLHTIYEGVRRRT